MTEFMGLAEKVSKFNQEALKHIEKQTLNPFSGRFSRSPSPRPKFSKDEYGKPAAGSLTAMRGQKASTQISREILELCEVIHDMGARRRDSDGDECIIIPFGELFAFYTKISDKVVGLLIAAKKRGFVYFEPEILFQRRDDDVLIALLKPISEIRNVITRQVSASPSPASPVPSEPPSEKTSPCPTPSPLARQESNTSEATSTPVEPVKPTPTHAPAAPADTTPVSSSSITPEVIAEQAPSSEQTSHVTVASNDLPSDRDKSMVVGPEHTEPTVTTEGTGGTKPSEGDADHDSLSLKILVPINEETSSHTAQAPDDNEQTPAPSDKNTENIPSTENDQTPPSNDTGEKTLS